MTPCPARSRAAVGNPGRSNWVQLDASMADRAHGCLHSPPSLPLPKHGALPGGWAPLARASHTSPFPGRQASFPSLGGLRWAMGLKAPLQTGTGGLRVGFLVSDLVFLR